MSNQYALALQQLGPMSSPNVIGEVTEAMHKFMLDNYNLSELQPRFEEDLSFVPKDREEVIYMNMYRVAHNENLQNTKRFRQAPVFLNREPEEEQEVYYSRPPLYLDVFYLVAVHSKFRSEAERLLGWVLLQLQNATHLIYRPRKFLLPDGTPVDSLGRPWAEDCEDDPNLVMEKVSLALVNDLTVGDAINLYTLNEAPYRPFLTYRARMALDGGLVAAPHGTKITVLPGKQTNVDQGSKRTSTNGRIRPGQPIEKMKDPPGPEAHFLRRVSGDADPETED